MVKKFVPGVITVTWIANFLTRLRIRQALAVSGIFFSVSHVFFFNLTIVNSETTSNEFWKFTKLIKEPTFAAVRQHLGNPIEQDGNSLYSSLRFVSLLLIVEMRFLLISRPKTTECTTSVSSSLFSHQQPDFDPKMDEKKARSCFRK